MFVVNGREKSFEAVRTVGELLAELKLDNRRVAVMVNDEVVRRAELPATPLKDGDRIEIIQMVGGG
jgi:sulfur carrier protein